ncbi:MAG: flagellar protein FlgN [Gammaproteobacteria bacterium]|nr:flagellar protein FlgN [Gammaproteobacteria bacterium]
MKNNHQSFKENLINEELKGASGLLSLLKKEHEALSNPQTSAAEITSLATQKEQLIKILEKVSQNRVAQLSSADPELLTPPLKSQWQQLQVLAHDCRQQNQINGIIIHSTKNFIEQTTAILLGKGPTTELLYGSSGKTINQNQARTIAKA